jgi:hypothetical protein
MWEGTTSRAMAADRPYGEFYDFYSVSPEYFGYTFVCLVICEYGNLEACLCLSTAHLPLNPLQNLSNEHRQFMYRQIGSDVLNSTHFVITKGYKANTHHLLWDL